MAERSCAVCEGPLPAGSNAGRKTCSRICRQTKWARSRGILSMEDRFGEPEHGTAGRYRGNKRYPPCRCDQCRAWNTGAHAAWVARQRALEARP